MRFAKAYRELRHRLRFYRHHSSYELMWGRLYFSQYGEDAFLLEYFRGKRDGCYVDVGAFHPIAYSNTYAFYRNGWSGLNIEPNPENQPLFRKVRPRDVTLALAVSDSEGTTTFAIEECLSGIVDHNYLHRERSKSMRQITVQTRPLRMILDEHVSPMRKAIDLLTVDCEGHDEVVLRSNDWERHRPLVVLCEAFGASDAISLHDFMENQSYRQIAVCGPTLVFEDVRNRQDRPDSYQ